MKYLTKTDKKIESKGFIIHKLAFKSKKTIKYPFAEFLVRKNISISQIKENYNLEVSRTEFLQLRKIENEIIQLNYKKQVYSTIRGRTCELKFVEIMNRKVIDPLNKEITNLFKSNKNLKNYCL